MRIVAGRLGGRKLIGPPGGQTRPTTGRVRESIFNLVLARITLEDARILDLFTGTGSLAFEALSRGASEATLVDNNSSVLRYTRKNCQQLDLSGLCRIIRADAMHFMKHQKDASYDLILADPPYRWSASGNLPDLALRLLKPGSLFVLEHETGTRFDEHPSLDTTRVYGRTLVSLFSA